MLKTASLFLAATVATCFASERATYTIAGGLSSLIANGAELPIQGQFVLTFEGGLRETMQPHQERARVTRDGHLLSWKGSAQYPNGTQSEFTADWTESDAGVALNGSVAVASPFPGMRTFRFPIDAQSVDYVIDLPRDLFVGGHLEPSGQPIPATEPPDPSFFRGTVDRLAAVDAQGNWRLALALDRPYPVTVTDIWDPAAGRFYRVSIQLHAGPWLLGDPLKLGLSLKLTGTPHAAAVALSVDPSATRYPFDGWGGNFRVYRPTPIVDYSLKNLRVTWARLAFNTEAWDRARHDADPGPMVRGQFELAQRIQHLGIPWILTMWSLPERYYTNPNQVPFGTFGRHIAEARWPEFLDLLGSYLRYMKDHYGAEPDYFSFNESDLGVNIGFNGETFRDAVVRVGSYLAAHGFKTKLLLGDTSDPHDTYKFALPGASDPEALRYIGAVSFHSWRSGTPAQYAAWGDVAEWIRRPLIVAEAGLDAGAYQNFGYDSYAYGLKEVAQFQDLLRYARPQAILYWQLTDDYSLVHVGPDGAIEPTGRFWMIKQLANLTPAGSEAVESSSDQPDVRISAFARGSDLAVHILNSGPARSATLAGLPAGRWRTVTTTEDAGYQPGELTLGEGAQPLGLPARSLTTLTRE